MRQSQFLTKTSKFPPQNEESLNAKLLMRAGYINKVMAGVYEFLPLAFMSVQNIIEIIREEMNKIGSQELFLSGLQNKEVWEKTNRWGKEASDVWFTTNLVNGSEVGLGWTHEEPITQSMTHHIHSYRDLPKYAYQFQTKFRNEARAKSGIMRTREFIMKDLYSFSKDEAEHFEFYNKIADAYLKVYERLGIGENTYKTFASGGAFSKFSDEFQTVTPVGEDIIYIHKEKKIAINKEIYTDEVLADLGVKKEELEEQKASEVGNIFTLGTRFSESLGLLYKDEKGKDVPVFMGSYGIGPARILGVIVEMFGDENSMYLPKEISPFVIHLLELGDTKGNAEKIYKELEKSDMKVFYDDRDEQAGEKFADSDLLGFPYRVIVSNKTMEKGADVVEFIDRKNEESKFIKVNEIKKEIYG